MTKLESAQRQLRAAMELFFANGDEVAIHTLTAAARQVLVDLLHRRGMRTRMEERFEIVIKSEFHKEAARAFARAENFFKHADRDPDDVIEFNPRETHFLLLDAGDAYRMLTNGRQLRELQAFVLWYIAEYPQHLKPAFKEGVESALMAGAPHKDRPMFFTAFKRRAWDHAGLD